MPERGKDKMRGGGGVKKLGGKVDHSKNLGRGSVENYVFFRGIKL